LDTAEVPLMSKVHKHAHGTTHHGHGAGKADDRDDDKKHAHGKHADKKRELPDQKLFKWQHDFAAVDKNHDGKLAKSELKVGKQAKAFDHDHDGAVTRAEYQAGFRQANSFAGLDKDHDGGLDASEMKGAHRFTKTSFDGDHDGKVTEAEFVAGRRDEGKALKEARLDHRFADMSGKQKKALKRYDTDHDGRISRLEFGAGRDADRASKATAKIAENFEKAGGKGGELTGAGAAAYKGYDKDTDGHVTEAEFLAGQKADRASYWKEANTGKHDAMLAKRLHLDALGLGLNKVSEAGAATGLDGIPAGSAKGATDVTISSFNLLGSSHTAAGGKDPGMASGPQRMKGAIELIKKHDVDIVGFQEMQKNQAVAFKKGLGSKYGLYPGPGKDSENSIAWRKDKWDMVKSSTVKIPYFNGHHKNMPVVLLRNKQTGQLSYFSNFHNPADTKQFHHQQKYRTQAMHKEIDLVNKLRKQTGLPVFVTGDMNEGNEYFNGMTNGARGMHSSAAKGGRAPKRPGIDWVFGSENVTFSRHVRDRGALVRRTTDHPMIIAKARIAKTNRKG
jgi:Ca2+-binding EF-hand superfamily protein